MLRIILALISTCLSLSAISQEMQLLKLDSPIDGFHRDGTSSMYHKRSHTSTPRIEMCEVKDGFILRTDFDLAKYTFEGNKLWEVTFEKEFRLQDNPLTRIVSDEYATYVVELKRFPYKATDLRVTHITPGGKVKRYVIESDMNRFVDGCPERLNTYVVGGELRIVARSKAYEKEIAEYRVYRFDTVNSKLNYKKIVFPIDDYEKKEGSYAWYLLHMDGDRSIWQKSYLQDVKGQKTKVVVMQLAELTNEDEVTNVKNLSFQPTANDDREFITPSLFWNANDRSVSVVGLMEIDKKKINGLYLLKYDYVTAKLVYKHEHHFIEILKPEIKTEMVSHYQIPEAADNGYPLRFRSEDILIDPLDGNIDLRIITNYDLMGMTFFLVKFDSEGNHIQTGIARFRAWLTGFGWNVPRPERYQLVWKDKVRANVPSSWDLITEYANRKEDVYFMPLRFRSGMMIKYDQNIGIFSLIRPN